MRSATGYLVRVGSSGTLGSMLAAAIMLLCSSGCGDTQRFSDGLATPPEVSSQEAENAVRNFVRGHQPPIVFKGFEVMGPVAARYRFWCPEHDATFLVNAYTGNLDVWRPGTRPDAEVRAAGDGSLTSPHYS